jgi:hypothetical protein
MAKLDEMTNHKTLSRADREAMRERGLSFKAAKRKEGKISPHSGFQAAGLIPPKIEFSSSDGVSEEPKALNKNATIPKTSILHKIDKNIGTIYNIYDPAKSEISTKSLRMMIASLSSVHDGSVDIDDGFEESIFWTNEEQEYINSNIWTKLQSEILRKDIDKEMHQSGAYICVVDSKKLEFFEILHRDYGIEYPIARKLAQEFASKAEATCRGEIPPTEDYTPSMVTTRFNDRKNKNQSPLEFLEEHYGRWLRGNGLYQHTLRKHDSVLMQYLDRRFVGRRDELSKILPKKSDEVNARLGPEAENMSPEQRKKALDAQRLSIK